MITATSIEDFKLLLQSTSELDQLTAAKGILEYDLDLIPELFSVDYTCHKDGLRKASYRTHVSVFQHLLKRKELVRLKERFNYFSEQEGYSSLTQYIIPCLILLKDKDFLDYKTTANSAKYKLLFYQNLLKNDVGALSKQYLGNLDFHNLKIEWAAILSVGCKDLPFKTIRLKLYESGYASNFTKSISNYMIRNYSPSEFIPVMGETEISRIKNAARVWIKNGRKDYFEELAGMLENMGEGAFKDTIVQEISCELVRLGKSVSAEFFIKQYLNSKLNNLGLSFPVEIKIKAI